jgi:HPt (histidine-containing phosphotransfer) domain-containing protein
MRTVFMNCADEFGVNFDKLTETTGLDAQVVIELLEIFSDITLTDLEQMRQGLLAGDFEEVCRRAHSIKGAALNLSLNGIVRAASAVEDCVRAGDTGELRLFYDDLLGRFDSVRRFLEDR